jgi:hypothetical protein
MIMGTYLKRGTLHCLKHFGSAIKSLRVLKNNHSIKESFYSQMKKVREIKTTEQWLNKEQMI